MNLADQAREQMLNMLRQLAIVRARHYKRLFRPDSGMSRDAEIVLADLRTFCFAEKTTFSMDTHRAARDAGRREVWLRIVQHLDLDESQVRKLMEVDSE